MEQSEELDLMEKRLEGLQAQFKELSLRLSLQGEAVQQGYPPDAQLIEEISACNNQFDAVKETLQQLGASYLSEVILQSVSSTSQLVQLWENIKAPLEMKREECSAPQAVAAAPPVDEASVLLKLVKKLIRENRLEPAFWLSAYYELWYEAIPTVPPLWLKMIEISRQVRPRHEAALQELASFYRDSAAVYKKELPFQWLAFAAALLPSLHAPSSGAGQVLEELTDLPQDLKNLTAIIGKVHREETQDETEQMNLLAAEAQHWFEQNQQINPASPLAARLWVSMLEENGLIYKLLNPIWANDRSQYDDVSQLVKYLEKEACQRKELSMQYGILLKKLRIVLKNQNDAEFDVFHISGSGMIMSRLQEVLKLTSRWLEIPAGREDDNRDTAVSQAIKMIDALSREQQGGILLELAMSLAKHTLELFANSIKKQALLSTDREVGKLTTSTSQFLAEPGLPAQEAIDQLGQALYNFFSKELKRSLQDEDINEVREDAGMAEDFGDLVPPQKKDLFMEVLNEEENL